MIPLDELKTALRLDPDDSTEDTYLVGLEAGAVAFVERDTGRYFGPPAERTEYLAAAGQRSLRLTDQPAADPAPVVILEGEAVAGTDYSLRGRELRSVGAGGWGSEWAPAEVAVTYTAGYADGAAPADVRQAVLLLVAHWYENRVPVVVGTVAADVKLTVRDLLAPWRRVGV